MRTIFAALIALISLSGCARLSVNDFDRGQTPEVQFQKDGAACEMEGQKAAGTVTEYKKKAYSEMFDSCMRSKGYSQN
jgi:uncharacterized protein YxeA